MIKEYIKVQAHVILGSVETLLSIRLYHKKDVKSMFLDMSNFQKRYKNILSRLAERCTVYYTKEGVEHLVQIKPGTTF